MAIAALYEGSETITTTEHSCSGNTGSVGSITTNAIVQVFLDLSAMGVSDQYQIRIYEKCRSVDTQRVIYESIITGPMAPTWVSPSLLLTEGWDVTLKKLAGTDRNLIWSIRAVN